MQIIQDTTEFQIRQKTAVAIGKFDGIHRGHEKLLSCILEQKKKGMAAVVFTFFPSASVFFGQGQDGELTTREEKRAFFEKLGIDILVEYPLNRQTAAIEPEEFLRKILCKQMNLAYVAAGQDLSFGYQGKGDRRLLERFSGELSYEVRIIDKVFDGEREISSTYVRECVEKGDMERAEELLGRAYSFTGRVERGKQLGRRLGMPTLNLYPPEEKLLPPRGVYYSRVLFEGGTYPGITNIGYKPTVNEEKKISVETYLYDFDRDMYGSEIVTELLHYKRPEKKFENISDLKTQMESDISQGRQYHNC